MKAANEMKWNVFFFSKIYIILQQFEVKPENKMQGTYNLPTNTHEYKSYKASIKNNTSKQNRQIKKKSL